MKFQISDENLRRRFRQPVYTFLQFVVFSLIIFSFLEDGTDEKMIITITLIICSIVGPLLNYFGARKYASMHKGHFIETRPEGFIIIDKETETILKWDNISTVKVKENGNGIKSMIFSTHGGASMDLSKYGGLNNLKTEIRTYGKNIEWS